MSTSFIAYLLLAFYAGTFFGFFIMAAFAINSQRRRDDL